MRIDLTEYNTNPDSIIYIYRSYLPFDSTNLPVPLATLSPDTEVYEDTTVELNRLVYYRTAVEFEGALILSTMYTTIKRFYTGPRGRPQMPDTIIRGDSITGRYGSFKPKDILPVQSVLDVLPGITLLPGLNLEELEYEKCIYNGNIVLLANKPFLYGSIDDLYKAGAFLTYGDGRDLLNTSLYSLLMPKVIQGREVVGIGSAYRLHLITKTEYEQLLVQLYPDSVAGSKTNRAIGNRNPFTEAIPYVSHYQVPDLTTKQLDETTGKINYLTKGPLYLVAELLNRTDLVYPEPEEDIIPLGNLPDMGGCNKVFHKGRIHFFGGTELKVPFSIPTTTHFSVNLQGKDIIRHAPVPYGSCYGVSWSDGVNLYCFGGMTKNGKDTNNWGEKTSQVITWNDALDTWSSKLANLEFDMCSAGLIRVNPVSGKNQLWVIGGDYKTNPELTNYALITDVDDFQGTFTRVAVNTRSRVGGETIYEYRGKVYAYGGGGYYGVISAILEAIILPDNAPDGTITSESIFTTGTESYPGRFMASNVWHDTAFIAGGSWSFDAVKREYMFWQWVEPEHRFRKIVRNECNLPANLTLNEYWHENRLYVLGTTEGGGEATLMVLTLNDPLDQPLKPIEDVIKEVTHYYTKTIQYWR